MDLAASENHIKIIDAFLQNGGAWDWTFKLATCFFFVSFSLRIGRSRRSQPSDFLGGGLMVLVYLTFQVQIFTLNFCPNKSMEKHWSNLVFTISPWLVASSFLSKLGRRHPPCLFKNKVAVGPLTDFVVRVFAWILGDTGFS